MLISSLLPPKVRSIALGVVAANGCHYSESLLRIFPKYFLEIRVNARNRPLVMNRLTRIRSKREDELAKMLGLEAAWRNIPVQRQAFQGAIGKEEGLTEEQRAKRKEISFITSIKTAITYAS